MREKMMSYGQEIYDSLENYIMDARYHQAVLLDGPWGSGKTWFIKNCFIPKFEEAHKDEGWYFLPLSLYGLETIEELKTKKEQKLAELVLKYFLQKRGMNISTKGKWLKMAARLKSAGPLLSAFLSKYGLQNLKLEDFVDVLATFDRPAHVVLVVDDLERARIRPEIVFGYISELTEQEDMKVIVLANETEVCQMHDLENEEEEKAKKPSEKNKKRERYDLIKEKTIGLDISYQVPLEEIYGEVLDTYVTSGRLKSYFLEQKEYILQSFDDNKSRNLRTLIFAFIACDTFYPLLEKTYDLWREGRGAETIFEDLIHDVIRYTVLCSITWKRENQLNPPNFTFLTNEHLIYTFHYSYPFVHSFIKSRRIDVEDLTRYTMGVLDDLLDRSQGRNEAYSKLMKWRLLNDDDAEDYLERLEGEILQKKLNPDYIRNLFLTLLCMSDAGIDVAMEKYVGAVITNLKKSFPLYFRVDMLFASSYVGDASLLAKYNEVLQPVYELIEAYFETSQKEAYQFLIQNEWDSAFKGKCREKMASFMEDKKFLAYLNPEEVLEKIRGAGPAEICYFMEGIQIMYTPVNIHDFFKADVPCIEAVLEGIEKMEDLGGKIKNKNVQQLAKLLKRSKGNLSDGA